MDDLKIALEDLKEESDSDSLASPIPTDSGRSRLRAIAILVGTVVLVAGWWMYNTYRSREPQTDFRETPFTADPGFEMYPVSPRTAKWSHIRRCLPSSSGDQTPLWLL